MRLTEFNNAPSFRIQDLKGESFDLNTPRDKPLMLCFFRYASCPLCNIRVHELAEQAERFKDKLDIVMVFQSPKEKIDEYVGKQDVPYIIIPDPERTLYELYKVENSWKGFFKAWVSQLKKAFLAIFKYHYFQGSVEGEIHRIPADFIIDTNNKIIRAFYGTDIGDHLPFYEIYEIMDNYETR